MYSFLKIVLHIAEVESTTQRGDAAAEVSKDIIGSSKNNTGIVATSLPGITTSTVTAPTGTASQDVKWNAAPTLLERQRENLTARLRREFGLCISDDDEDKSGECCSCLCTKARNAVHTHTSNGIYECKE